MHRGPYTQSNIGGKEKVGLSAGEPICEGGGGGGAYRQRNMVFSQFQIQYVMHRS